MFNVARNPVTNRHDGSWGRNTPVLPPGQAPQTLPDG